MDARWTVFVCRDGLFRRMWLVILGLVSSGLHPCLLAVDMPPAGDGQPFDGTAKPGYQLITPGANVFTWKDYRAQEDAWFSGIYRAASSRATGISPAQAAAVNDLFQAFVLSSTSSTAESLLAEADRLLASGDMPPALLRVRGMLLNQLGRTHEAKDAMIKALAVMEKAGEPGILLFTTSFRLAGICRAAGVDDQPYTRKSWRYLAQAAAEKEVKAGGQRFWLSRLEPFFSRCGPAPPGRPEVTAGLEARSSEVDPWIREITSAWQHIIKAWDIRGGGWASSVKPEAWEGFRRELLAARALLESAHARHPDWPEAARSLITVEMALGCGGQHDIHGWFRLAVAAHFDYIPAYQDYALALRPRWCGSHRQMYELGRACLDSGRFDTEVPRQFLAILWHMGEDLGGLQSVYRVPGVYEQVARLYGEWIRLASGQEQVQSHKTWLAVAAWEAGKLEEAARLYAALGKDFNPRVWADFRVAEEDFLRDLRPFLGLEPKPLDRALALLPQDPAQAVTRLAAAADDPAAPVQDHILAWQELARLQISGNARATAMQVSALLDSGRREAAFIVLWSSRDQLPEALLERVHPLHRYQMRMFPGTDARPGKDFVGQHQKLLADQRAILGPPEDKSLDDELALASIRILLWQARRSGILPEKTMGKEFAKLHATGSALEFVQAHLNRPDDGKIARFHLARDFHEQVACCEDQQPERRQKTLARLKPLPAAGLKAALPTELAASGSPSLRLELAKLCRERGLSHEAKRLEGEAFSWLALLVDGMEHTSWTWWQALATYAMIDGYEQEALPWAERYFENGDYDSGCYLAADIHGRLGNHARAVDCLLRGPYLKADRPIVFFLPGKKLNGVPALRRAVLQRVLAHPDLTAVERDRLRKAFPAETREPSTTTPPPGLPSTAPLMQGD